jgi:hypothetical protein
VASPDLTAVTLPDGRAVASHLGRDITVVVAGDPPVSVRELVEAAMRAGRAIKVVRTSSDQVRDQLGARVTVLDTSGAVRWQGDTPPPSEECAGP